MPGLFVSSLATDSQWEGTFAKRLKANDETVMVENFGIQLKNLKPQQDDEEREEVVA